jgi:hypothetical protein
MGRGRCTTMKHGGGSVTVWEAISWYSVDPIIILHGRITVREHMNRLGSHVHPIIQTLFPSNDAVFQDDNAPIHTPGTDQSLLEKHEGELQHLPWSAYSPDLNIIEPLCSVLETRVRNRFPPPTTLKQLDVLQKEWYKIPLETVQNLYESIPRQKVVQHQINEEVCRVSVVFPLFCPTPVFASAMD